MAWAASQYGDRVLRVSSPGEKAWGPGGILCYGTAPEGIGITSTACWFLVQSQSHVSSKGEEVHSTSLWQNEEIMNSIWEWTCCCSRFWKLQSAVLWSLRISDPCAPSPIPDPLHRTMRVVQGAYMDDLDLDALRWEDEPPGLSPFLPLPACGDHGPEIPREANCGQGAHLMHQGTIDLHAMVPGTNAKWVASITSKILVKRFCVLIFSPRSSPVLPGNVKPVKFQYIEIEIKLEIDREIEQLSEWVTHSICSRIWLIFVSIGGCQKS